MPEINDQAMMAEHERRHPKGVAVLKSERKLRIEWETGQVTYCSFGMLRKLCPCAECRSKREQPNSEALVDPMGELSILAHKEMNITSAKPVGNYALQLEWSDGHNHGIYTWDYLWGICSEE